jgi:methylthioribose-1-phosphate isomerase
MSVHTLALCKDHVEILDQRRLPSRVRYLRLRSGEEVARAIEQMAVRGAPAIGVAAAMGVAIELQGAPDSEIAARLERVCARLARTRPTAANLTWSLRRVEGHLRALLAAGEALLAEGARVLTHCNAGALATAGYGTALGVVRSAARKGKLVRVLASETRPFLQGARLTAWELKQEGIPVVLITDSMAGALMGRGEIDSVVVGADRIAANGDVANKIGTYTHAVLSRRHGIPFYVAAPLSTVDLSTATGAEIPIEHRDPDEVLTVAGRRIAPRGVEALHPAFDITPAELVTAIVTERGVLLPPFGPSLARAVEESRRIELGSAR